MRLALGAIGWPPAAFWGATPRELAAAIEGRFGRTGGAVDRSALDRLMAAYPDGEGQIPVHSRPMEVP
jgi:uncharacterized phage protein (TIGR02216 family)